ncbi:Fur family transcriptional regulator [Hyphomonas sp. FCG-A18]|uniref:Fur family transcriptional regulator n=1 Tax=Hyphomonas sp. FCG-A18 TaxID=3080019 RepID=UPI002B2C8EBA|nr:Fur family transcriptional regulator [Hyphomonas sp. FCG-A18]
MTRLRKTTAASGQRRLHRRRWRGQNTVRPTHTDLLDAAQEEARAEGKSLTQIRRHVLATLLQAERPMTAYEVLASLEGVGSISPPTAYRALDFLIHLGYVKRVESLNAYIALDLGPSEAPIALFVCEKCGQAKEIEAPQAINGLLQAVSQAGMKTDQTALEIRGDCNGTLGCQPVLGEETLGSIDQHSHE